MAWQYPTGVYKAWVPKGRGLRAAMRGLREGVSAFSTQMLAIKQFEADKEEKRLERQREQAMEQVEIRRQEELTRQADLKAEKFLTREEDFKKVQWAAEMEHDIRIEQMRQAGKLKGEKDKWAEEEMAIFESLEGLKTPRAQRLATKMRGAWGSRDLDPIHQVGISAPLYPELAYGTTKTTITEGEEGARKKVITQGAIEDLRILQEASRRFMNLGKQRGYKLTKEAVYLGETADFELRIKEALAAPTEEEYQKLIQKLLGEGYHIETIRSTEARLLSGR